MVPPPPLSPPITGRATMPRAVRCGRISAALVTQPIKPTNDARRRHSHPRRRSKRARNDLRKHLWICAFDFDIKRRLQVWVQPLDQADHNQRIALFLVPAVHLRGCFDEPLGQ